MPACLATTTLGLLAAFAAVPLPPVGAPSPARRDAGRVHAAQQLVAGGAQAAPQDADVPRDAGAAERPTRPGAEPARSEPAAQKVTTFLMFEGRAEEAMTFYVSLFAGARIESIERYGRGEAGAEGSVEQAAFSIDGQRFMCIDSSVDHAFGFTPAISLFVTCDAEAELDALFAKLSEDGDVFMPPGAYGFSAKFAWLADRFGVAWQLNLPE